MLWIKRNLFLVVGGLLGLALLGFGGYYFWTNYQQSNSGEEELKQAKEELKRLSALVPFPNSTNIALAHGELQHLQNAINLTQKSFTPLPYQRVKGQAFKSLLDTTVDELQKKADQKGVGLPLTNRYAFTFAEQQKRFQFTEGSFPTLAEQLAEIQAICTILFDAKINKLTSLRRGRVTTDDIPTAIDYHELCPNRTLPSGAVVSAYMCEFNSFSSDLAAVLEGFYKSPNGLLVKSVEIKPLEEALPAGAPVPAIAIPPPGTPPGNTPPVRPRVVPPPAGTPGTPPPKPPPHVAGTPPPKPGAAAGVQPGEILKTVLDERMLKISLWVDVLKPPAK